MDPDIESYLNNELSSEVREQFEAKLATDPAMRAALEQMRPAWHTLRRAGIAEQVETVMRERERRRRRWIAILAGVIALGIGGLGWWKLHKSEPGIQLEIQAPEPREENLETPVQEPSVQTTPALNEPIDSPKSPIAMAPDPNPDRPAPVYRGLPAQEVLPAAGIALADSFLLRYTPYEFINLAVLNDYWETQNFKKYYNALEGLVADKGSNPSTELIRGACLLRLHRPASAMNALFPLRQAKKKVAQEADWLLALAFVMQGKDESARAGLERIAGNESHPKKADAAQLLQQMKE